jgi:hypothetical protein
MRHQADLFTAIKVKWTKMSVGRNPRVNAISGRTPYVPVMANQCVVWAPLATDDNAIAQYVRGDNEPDEINTTVCVGWDEGLEPDSLKVQIILVDKFYWLELAGEQEEIMENANDFAEMYEYYEDADKSE